MNSNNPHNEEKLEMNALKTKSIAILGCSGTIILGILVIILSAWIFINHFFSSTSTETQIMISQSPNEKNKIEFFKVDEFPDPTLKIKFGNRYIIKTSVLPIPDNISVEWENDKEAEIILNGKGKEPHIERIEFK